MGKMKDDNFLKTKLNCGIVFSSDLEGIQRAKEALAQTGVKLVYQTVSADRIFIIRKGEETHE